jgi:DNA-binding NtrC family response regulator
MVERAVNRALLEEMIGQSPCMRQLRERMARLARYDVNLLLQGESGTGKELVARTIHRQSQRASRPFIGVNCAAIHESLLESELFGHEAGAFTGAAHTTLGFLRAAEGGTILLDEVGDMSESLQSKLLRVLEERAVVPVGGTRSVPIDLRVISATHRNLSQAVQEGGFRQDLYYRLNVVCLSMTPLRDRRGDIPPLAEHMLRRIAGALRVPLKKLSPPAMDAMVSYDWPGNVRELANVIRRGYVFAAGPAIEIEDLPPELLGKIAGARTFPTLKEAVSRHVEKALEISEGRRTQAARMLAVDRGTLRRMIHRYSLR